MAESQSLSAMSLPEIKRHVSSVERMSSKVSQMEKDRLRDHIEIEALQTLWNQVPLALNYLLA